MRSSPPSVSLRRRRPRPRPAIRLPSARKSSLQREDDEAGGEDQHPGERHLERLADRQPAHREGADDQDQAADKINEIKGLVAVVSQLDLHPVIARLDPCRQLGAAASR